MTHINRKIIITIDGEKGQSGKTTVEITENGKPKTRFEWTEATFTSLILMEIATDILCACHEDMMKHWMKYNHVPDAGEMEVYEVGKGTTVCGQDYKCKKDYKEGNCWYIKDAIYHCGRDGYLTDQNGISWSCTPKWFREHIQSNREWAEEEKTRFVGGQFLQCKLSFGDFKEGEHYWLEYVGDDTYVGRSDNILNQKFHITPRQLFTLFSQELEEYEEQKEQKSVEHFDLTKLIVPAKLPKEQKPAEWSEEDENMRNKIIWLLSGFIYPNSLYGEDAKECIDWIKSPRSRPKSSDNLPKWKKASAGTKLPSESVIRRDGEDPRFGSVAVYDCEYITIKELGKLPKEDQYVHHEETPVVL